MRSTVMTSVHLSNEDFAPRVTAPNHDVPCAVLRLTEDLPIFCTDSQLETLAIEISRYLDAKLEVA